MNAVEKWRANCDPKELPAIDAVRAIVCTAGPNLEESIKWNAPSFALDGQDRITLGIERKGGVRVVLHRGAAKTGAGFVFADPEGIARWPSPDRGVLTYRDAAAVEADADRLLDLLQRWLAA